MGQTGERMIRLTLLPLLLVFTVAVAQTPNKTEFVKKETRNDSIRATLKLHGYPNLEGKWYWIGPFDNTDKIGFDMVYPPEKKIELDQKYEGKKGQVTWKQLDTFVPGSMFNLAKLVPKSNDTVVYLYHEIEVKGDDPVLMPLMLGSDDSISVFLNGKRILHEDAVRPAAPDQNQVELALKPGKNQLLLKVGNVGGNFEVYAHPEFPKSMAGAITKQLERNFPNGGGSATATPSGNQSAEAKHYRIVTLNQPPECVLEVGGLAFRPDGKLLACTRRGEVWMVTNPTSDEPTDMRWSRFATGLHEALGLNVEDNNTVYVTQRPELTKLVDKNGDGKADEFFTICDKWGCSGDYHEFAFGTPRDKDGNFYITLNVGFGGGHQAKSPWRGFCVKVSPKGDMEPIAWGLRSPNGVSFSPEGELFYCDNQGEWVATNKMHHIQKGEFYGHQASLVWLKETDFIKKFSDKVQSGMLYDGQKGPAANAPMGFPELTPPVIWFPYGRMGQSASEPRFDATGGKFGPFAGQCFVGDQTKSMIMRVALEKVGGRYQGACFPFRSGFQCGINRLVFGPDGSLFVGQTNRGWGSVGPKPYGLQRLVYTGELPFEILTMKLTKTGFDLTFTKPVDPETVKKLESFTMKSFTYVYFSNYGCPETDTRVEGVIQVKTSEDNKTISLTVPNLRPGRVFDLHLDGVKSKDGDALLHADAYYTLNQLVK
jgi:hypothetical protein